MKENEKTDEVSLKELILKINEWLTYFLSQWKWILVTCIIGGAIGLFLSFRSKPVYTSEITFASEEKSASNPYAGIASQFGIDVGGGGSAFAGDNILELMKSRRLIEKTLLTTVNINDTPQLLINRFIAFNDLDANWNDKNGLAGIHFEENEPGGKFSIEKDSILNTIQKTIKSNLEVNKLDKKLSIIKVVYKSEDELFAKYFAEVLVKNVSEFYIETKTRKSKTNISLLENRVDSVKAELDNEIYGAAVTKDRNMNAIRAQSGVPSVKKQMKVQILTTMYGELIKNLETSKFMLMREEPLFLMIDQPRLPLEKRKLGKITGSILGSVIGGFIALLYLSFIRIKKIIIGMMD